MTRPAPTVTVPVEPIQRLILAADSYGVRYLDSDDMTAEAQELQDATEAMKDALAAAPAPSSMAGGEVSRAVEHLTKRLNKPGAFHLSDQTSIRAILAALSPEAPARIVGTIAHVSHGRSELAAQITAALTPRHEAPASAIDDLVDRFAVALKEKLHVAEAKYGHDDAWLRDDWRDDLIRQLGEHVQKGDPRDVAAYCAFAWHHDWPVGHEAPADGAGERDQIKRAIADGFSNGYEPYDKAGEMQRLSYDMAADAVIALSNRTSEPEAGGAARIIACHLPIPETPDTVCLPITMTVGDLRSIYAALRARSSAPEAREGGAVGHRPECWGSTSYSGEMAHCYCSQSTAAPSADELREGDKLTYDMGEGVKLRATYVGPDEGWAKVTFDADGLDAQAVTVRPSRLSPRQSTTPDALKGDAK